MTDTTLQQIASFKVPATAMKQAIMALHPASTSGDRLAEIALRHGGGTLLAQAIELRLGLLGLVRHAEPNVLARPRSVPADVLARILVDVNLTTDNGAIAFDGDELVATLRSAGTQS